MADWNKPVLTGTSYTNWNDELKARDLDNAKWMDSAVVTVTNPTADMKRWNAASRIWERYNGSTWVALATTYNISIDGAAGAVPWSGITGKPTTLAGFGITDGQPLDADLTAIAAFGSTGFAARTATNTWAQRTMVAPAAGLTIANPAGVAGNPTYALADDLAALEALGSVGFAVRTALNTWVQRALAAASTKVTVTNGDGVAGAPTIDVNEANFTLALLKTLIDAKGDLVVGTANDTSARKAAGSNGAMLVPSSGATDGLAWVSAGLAMWNGSIKVEHNVPTTNQMRISLKTAAGADPSASDPVVLGFRSATLGNGDFTTALVTSALNLDVSAGATLGFINNGSGRIYVGAMLNGSAVELFAYLACNTSNLIKGFNEHDLISTTIMSASSDSAQVAYSTTARSNLPWRMAGWFEITTGATAGNWTNAASKIQTMMPGVPRHGDVIQRVAATSEGGSSTTSTSNTDVTGATLSITPTSLVNRLKLHGDGVSSTGSLFASGHSIVINVMVDANAAINDRVLNAAASGSNVLMICGWAHTFMYLPDSISAVVYKIRHRGTGGQTIGTFNVHLVAEEVFS